MSATTKAFVCFFLACLTTSSSAALVDGIVTLSWSTSQRPTSIERFLTNQTRIQLKVLCRIPSNNVTTTREQIQQQTYQLDKTMKDTNIKITGRIGRVVGCLPLQPETFVSSKASKQEEKNDQRDPWVIYYDQLWKQMEQRTFTAHQSDCDYTGTHVYVDDYSPMKQPEISPDEAMKLRQQAIQANDKRIEGTETGRRRRAVVASPSGQLSDSGQLLTWADGFYIIEINAPEVTTAEKNVTLDVDVILAMINRHGGYITADEYPALIFYGVMCGIYALFALLWLIWCALYWRELLKVQFWIGGVILIGMIEKSAFVAEYDTINRNGVKVHYAIVAAEVLSCLKRSVSRMLVIIVALGYGIVKPRLGPLKQKVLAMGILFFSLATTEAILRLNAEHDESNNKVFISRIPLAVIDAVIYYWIFTGLVATTRTLRLRKNLVKLNVYRHFTNMLLFAILASLLFMVWSLKSHFFTTCIINWREFWVDDAFWHILFSLILLAIMFLFRPSNNNQRYAFVPLLDQSDNDDDFADGDEEKGESAVFDSITMRKSTSNDLGGAAKNKKQQQTSLNRDGNVANSGLAGPSGSGTVEDALTWVEDNIPTAIADQALQALDSEDEIVQTRLERSKMQ